MTQLIKPNDLVYTPSETEKVYKVEPNGDEFIIDYGDFIYHINAQGQKFCTELYSWGSQTFAFLATPENKERLELVYGKLEDIPVDEVDEELEKFSKTLDEISYFYAKLNSLDSNFKPTDKFEELKSIKSKLIQMFKERGAK